MMRRSGRKRRASKNQTGPDAAPPVPAQPAQTQVTAPQDHMGVLPLMISGSIQQVPPVVPVQPPGVHEVIQHGSSDAHPTRNNSGRHTTNLSQEIEAQLPTNDRQLVSYLVFDSGVEIEVAACGSRDLTISVTDLTIALDIREDVQTKCANMLPISVSSQVKGK